MIEDPHVLRSPASWSEPPGLPSAWTKVRGSIVDAAAAVTGVVFGLFYVRLLLTLPDESVAAAKPAVADLAPGALILIPGIFALLASRRPALYLAGGCVAVPFGFFSFGEVSLPLLIPAWLSLAAYERRCERPGSERRPVLAAPVIAMLTFVLGTVAFRVLHVHEDPRCRAIPNGISCVSDIVTSAEAVVSLAITGLAIASAWVLAKPRRETPDAQQ